MLVETWGFEVVKAQRAYLIIANRLIPFLGMP
jgi:hypothetical protein